MNPTEQPRLPMFFVPICPRCGFSMSRDADAPKTQFLRWGDDVRVGDEITGVFRGTRPASMNPAVAPYPLGELQTEDGIRVFTVPTVLAGLLRLVPFGDQICIKFHGKLEGKSYYAFTVWRVVNGQRIEVRP